MHTTKILLAAERLHLQALDLVLLALHEAFPCPP
jgi:hypothetical protein